MNILSKPWTKNYLPRRILAIRFHAMGDVVITLPYLQQLRNSLPANTILDLLIREETESIPKSLKLFDKVYSIKGGRNFKKQLIYTFFLFPKLFFRKYDVVIDLQDNVISRSVMRLLMPKAWSLFDRLSPIAAGERTRCTIEAIGLGKCFADSSFKLINKNEGIDLLKKNGWDNKCDLVILNPAGAFETRNWKMFNYVQFAKLWLEHFPNTKFLISGADFIRKKADYLEEKLGYNIINLVNKTTPAQAFSIVQNVKFVLSEDSGLMHMAWVSGIPTIALFGSTQSAKARPLGDFTAFFDSSDLPCGNCMLERCKYGDTHCLSRYSPEMIFKKAINLLMRDSVADAK
jgi:heptosyltransferase II